MRQRVRLNRTGTFLSGTSLRCRGRTRRRDGQPPEMGNQEVGTLRRNWLGSSTGLPKVLITGPGTDTTCSTDERPRRLSDVDRRITVTYHAQWHPPSEHHAEKIDSQNCTTTGRAFQARNCPGWNSNLSIARILRRAGSLRSWSSWLPVVVSTERVRSNSRKQYPCGPEGQA